jgi:hypothetical protein
MPYSKIIQKFLKKFFRIFFYSLAVVFIFISQGKTQSFPSWFYEPGSPEAPGALGFSNLTFKGEEHAKWLAKCRALQGLCEFENWNCKLTCNSYFSLKKLKKQVEKVANSYKIHFDTAKINLSAYEAIPVFVAYAYLKKVKNLQYIKDCYVCSIKKCKPSYLCNPSVEKYAGSIGCAEMSINFMKQYQLALKRAIELFGYLYQVEVDVKELKKVIKTNLSSFKLRLKKAKLTPSGRITSLRLMVRSICLNNDRLYLYLISPDIIEKKVEYSKPCWIENPYCLGKYVAVGRARPNINGYYAQVKQAIINALIELAKSKGTKIRVESIKKDIKGSFSKFKIVFQNVQTGVKQTVSARLIGIYQKGNIIYAGVMEVK